MNKPNLDELSFNFVTREESKATTKKAMQT